MGNSGRWRRAPVTVPVVLLLASGAVSALANFVAWPIAVLLGALAAGAGLAGSARLSRSTGRDELVRQWRSVTAAGPSSEPVAEDSVLAALNPDREIVAFSPLRESDVKKFLRWADDATGGRLWLVTGPAGCGKTRLLIEAARRAAPHHLIGWTRRGRGTEAVRVAAAMDRPVLLVVDDADTHAEMAAMLTALDGHPAVRILAATRDVASWWPRLRAELTPETDAEVPAQPQTVLASLTADAVTQQQRFQQALKYFAAAWDRTPPKATIVPPEPPAPLLLIHAAAAVAVHDGRTGRVELDQTLDRLFEIEETWWQRTAAEAGLPPVGVQNLRAAVVTIALLGADSLDDATRTLHQLPGLQAAASGLLRQIALWLRRLYPNSAGAWLDPQLPARIVERLVATRLAADPSLLAAIAAVTAMPVTATPGPTTADRPARVLTRLAAACRHTPVGAHAVTGLLRARPRLFMVAVQVALDDAGPIDQAVAAAVDAADPQQLIEFRARVTTTERTLTHTSVAVARRLLAGPLDEPDRALLLENLSLNLIGAGDPAAALPPAEETVSVYRRLVATEPLGYGPHLALAIGRLGIVRALLGERDEAVATTTEAVTLLRGLAATDPIAFEPDLARTLGHLGSMLSEVGLLAEATEAATEATGMFRRLVPRNPVLFESHLASALTLFGEVLGARGQRAEALAAATEASEILGRLAAVDPANYDLARAAGLNSLSLRFGSVGDLDAAVGAATEATDILRRLADADPAAGQDPRAGSLSSLAASLNTLAAALLSAGRLDEAEVVGREAIARSRRLAAANPPAFDPYLISALINLVGILGSRGRWPAAVPVSTEAVRVGRRLGEQDPATYEPSLANALINHSGVLSGAEQYEEATRATIEAVSLLRRLAGAEPAAYDGHLAIALTNLGLDLFRQARYAESADSAAEAVAKFRRLAAGNTDAYPAQLAIAEDCLRHARDALAS